MGTLGSPNPSYDKGSADARSSCPHHRCFGNPPSARPHQAPKTDREKNRQGLQRPQYPALSRAIISASVSPRPASFSDRLRCIQLGPSPMSVRIIHASSPAERAKAVAKTAHGALPFHEHFAKTKRDCGVVENACVPMVTHAACLAGDTRP